MDQTFSGTAVVPTVKSNDYPLVLRNIIVQYANISFYDLVKTIDPKYNQDQVRLLLNFSLSVCCSKSKNHILRGSYVLIPMAWITYDSRSGWKFQKELTLDDIVYEYKYKLLPEIETKLYTIWIFSHIEKPRSTVLLEMKRLAIENGVIDHMRYEIETIRAYIWRNTWEQSLWQIITSKHQKTTFDIDFIQRRIKYTFNPTSKQLYI